MNHFLIHLNHCESAILQFKEREDSATENHGLFLSFFFFLSFAISWAAPAAYGDSQARSRIRTVATSLHHSHSNLGSELYLQPIPQLTTTSDP